MQFGFAAFVNRYVFAYYSLLLRVFSHNFRIVGYFGCVFCYFALSSFRYLQFFCFVFLLHCNFSLTSFVFFGRHRVILREFCFSPSVFRLPPQQSDDTATDEQRDNERVAKQSEALGSEFDCRLGQFGFLVELVLLSLASIERLDRQIVVTLIECALAISQPNLVELRCCVGVFIPEFNGIFQAEQGTVEAIVVSLLDRLGP